MGLKHAPERAAPNSGANRDVPATPDFGVGRNERRARRLILKRELLKRQPESYPTIWKKMRAGLFPLPVKLGDGPNGIVIAGDIKHEFPQIGVIVLSAHRDKEFLAGFIDEGVTGWSFLLKQSVSDVQSLVRAIESAASGRVTIDSSVIGDLFPRQNSVLERLTHRQLEALMFISSGYANSAIGEELGISEDLVEPLVKTIYDDLHIHENESVDQRVRATLLYLEETAQVSP